MARDEGLEALVTEDLDGVAGLTTKRMFGGLAWLLNGHLLCGASDKGLLLRVGTEREGRALAMPGVAAMAMRGRSMRGWVRAQPDLCGHDARRKSLMAAALDLVRALPPKDDFGDDEPAFQADGGASAKRSKPRSSKRSKS